MTTASNMKNIIKNWGESPFYNLNSLRVITSVVQFNSNSFGVNIKNLQTIQNFYRNKFSGMLSILIKFKSYYAFLHNPVMINPMTG